MLVQAVMFQGKRSLEKIKKKWIKRVVLQLHQLIDRILVLLVILVLEFLCIMRTSIFCMKNFKLLGFFNSYGG